jgi:hypothetical protein
MATSPIRTEKKILPDGTEVVTLVKDKPEAKAEGKPSEGKDKK